MQVFEHFSREAFELKMGKEVICSDTWREVLAQARAKKGLIEMAVS